MSSMSTRLLSIITITVTVASLFSKLVFAQQPSVKEEAGPTLSVNMVLLDAQILSKKTHLGIQGLKPEDIELSEDGVRQRILFFSQDALPLSIVLLLDVSQSISTYFDSIQAAALAALRKLKESDEVSLMVFGGSAR